MGKGLKNITKTKITKRSDELAKMIIKVFTKSKQIKSASGKKKEEVLFKALLREKRNSIKKAHAFNAWEKFVTEQMTAEK